MTFLFIGTEVETSTGNRPSYWTLDASIHEGRSGFGSALLSDGRVIISGGCLNPNSITSSSEIYTPSTGWQSVSEMKTHRIYFSLTPFANNTKALAAGIAHPADGRTAEVFDSETNTWTLTSTNMSIGRFMHTATLLGNGQILIAGGINASLISISAAEIYIPSSNSFINTTNMILPRSCATSTLLSDGSTVLVTGGVGAENKVSGTAELYINGSWIGTTNDMTQLRAYHAAVLLNDGNVLIAGGGVGGLVSHVSAEIYNATTHNFTVVGSMKYPRALLPSGQVLAAGGFDWYTKTLPKVCELYDPVTASWSESRLLNNVRSEHQTILFNNSVLVIGGANSAGGDSLDSTEKYNL